jgi:hypothetical protein
MKVRFRGLHDNRGHARQSAGGRTSLSRHLSGRAGGSRSGPEGKLGAESSQYRRGTFCTTFTGQKGNTDEFRCAHNSGTGNRGIRQCLKRCKFLYSVGR